MAVDPVTGKDTDARSPFSDRVLGADAQREDRRLWYFLHYQHLGHLQGHVKRTDAKAIDHKGE